MYILGVTLKRGETFSVDQKKNHAEFFVGVTQLFSFDLSRIFERKVTKLYF